MKKKIRTTRPRRGSVLVLALTVMIVLTSLVLMMARTARGEAVASANYLAQLQADAAARGAIEYLRTTLANTSGTLPDDSGIYSENQQVSQGYFWLLKHDTANTGTKTYTYGITDEAGKLNVNSADIESLSKLPNMTSELAAGIVDWRDADDTPGAGGAESQYYLMQPKPYNAKNANFESLEELLLVKDITPTLLFGSDTNRNGVLDATDFDPANPTGKISQYDGGIADFVTVFSVEPNTDSSGQARVNINNPAQRPQLGDVLRTVGAPLPPPGRVYENVIDFYYATNLPLDQFKKIVDRLTTSGGQTNVGLVNLKTAPREVLAALPQMTDADASAIISRRESGGLTDLASMTEALTREKATAIGGRVTLKSYRCSADIVACSTTGRAFKRYQAVFDTRTTPVKVIYVRDITNLGWPLDSTILTQLREGQAIASLGTGSITNQTGAK